VTNLILAGDSRFEAKFRQFRYSAFRCEALQVYRGSGEDSWIAAFERGDPAPPPDRAQEEWEAMIRANKAAGRIMQRVHIVREPLHLYLEFELTWAYAPNVAAGEDIRVIAVTGAWPADLPTEDFHLFDNSELFDAHYADDGTWLGVTLVTDPVRIVQACRRRAVARRRHAVADLHHATTAPRRTTADHRRVGIRRGADNPRSPTETAGSEAA